MENILELIDTDVIEELKSIDGIRESSERVLALQMVETSTIVGLKLHEVDMQQLDSDLQNLTSLTTRDSYQSQNRASAYTTSVRALKPTKRKIELDIDFF